MSECAGETAVTPAWRFALSLFYDKYCAPAFFCVGSRADSPGDLCLALHFFFRALGRAEYIFCNIET